MSIRPVPGFTPVTVFHWLKNLDWGTMLICASAAVPHSDFTSAGSMITWSNPPPVA